MNKLSLGLAAALFSVSLNASAAISCADPKAFVEDVKNQVLSVIKSSESDDQKRTTLNSDFRAIADITGMGKFALGRAYASLTPDQEQQYATAYADYMSASYVNRFKKYNGQTITVNSMKPQNANFAVDTTINSQGESPVDVVYVLKSQDGCFKVVDIVAENVSLVNTQRQDFNSVFNAKGFDGLVGLLKQKTDQFNSSAQ